MSDYMQCFVSKSYKLLIKRIRRIIFIVFDNVEVDYRYLIIHYHQMYSVHTYNVDYISGLVATTSKWPCRVLGIWYNLEILLLNCLSNSRWDWYLIQMSQESLHQVPMYIICIYYLNLETKLFPTFHNKFKSLMNLLKLNQNDEY